MAERLILDKQAIRRRFDRAATAYDGHSPIQEEMAQQLVDSIAGDGAPQPSRILELGCGTGHLTARLRDRFPQASVDAVDFAPAMIAITRERVPGARLITADIEELAASPASPLREQDYDLIASSATFQWLADPAATLGGLAAALAPGGRLYVSTFGPRTFWELDAVLAELNEERGLSQRSSREWETLLAGAGLHRIRAQSYEERFSYPDCATFLRSVKTSGAGYSPRRLPPRVLAEALRRYDERFRNPAGGGTGVTVTYEIVMLAAER